MARVSDRDELEWETASLAGRPRTAPVGSGRRRFKNFGKDFASLGVFPLIRSIEARQRQVLKGAAGNFQGRSILLVWLTAEQLASITLHAIVNEAEAVHLAGDEEDDTAPGLRIRVLEREIGTACMRLLVRLRTEQLAREKRHRGNDLLARVVLSDLATKRRTAVGASRRFVARFDHFVSRLPAVALTKSAFWKGHRSDFERLGTVLLECAIEASVLTASRKGAKQWVVGPRNQRFKEGEITTPRMADLTDGFLAQLQEEQGHLDDCVQPDLPPTIKAPRDWKSVQGGPYVDPTISVDFVRPSLVDRWKLRKMLSEAERRGQLRRVFRAVNAMQRTPWRINSEVLQTMTALWQERQQVFPGLPEPPRALPKPRDLAGVISKAERKKLKKRWAIYLRVRSLRTAAILYLRRLMPARFALARKLLEQGRPFYFPYFLDFRGRAYPVPRTFHPQDDDIGRALLEFADGEPLGRNGEFWLKVHVANMWGNGLDKRSFEARCSWVDHNRRRIMSSAARPRKWVRWWSQADKPWRFLAASLEWSAYLACRRNGRLFRSHMPVALDGTCNGIQHLTALAGDPSSAVWVNLTPTRNDRPRDIYRRAADLMITALTGERGSSKSRRVRLSPRAARGLADWYRANPLTARKVAKLAIMNHPYGIGPYRVAQKLCIDKKLLPERVPAIHQNPWTLAYRLGELLLSGVAPDLLGGGRGVMEWLRKDFADPLANQGFGVRWAAPSGWPVLHEYRRPRQKRIRTPLGTSCWPDEARPGRELIKSKQVNAIVPNLIHSLDAAHMVLTINELAKSGITSLAVVHDSYAVHARYVPRLRKTLSETFVKVHDRDILNGIWLSARQARSDVASVPPPKRGPLRITDVVEAKYPFS